jgi:AraC family transcriptional regulator
MRAEIERYTLEPPRFEKGKDLQIAGVNVNYTFETRVNIPAQWTSFAQRLDNIPGRVGKASYGVCWNFKPGCGFDYLTGVEVSVTANLPKDFSQVHVPACRYAVFAHRKHVSSIPDTIEAIWTKWLPNSGHQAAETPSFERYGEKFDPQAGMGDVEIWVPLKS